MTKPLHKLFLLLLLASAGCDKTDPFLLNGDINGIVKVYDENMAPLEDMSGVRVSLLADSVIAQTATGSSGEFLLEGISYGNYRIDLHKEAFVKTDMDYTLHHLGGYSPTLVEYRMYEIPTFGTTIDSIVFNGKYESSFIYVTLSGLSGLPRIGYYYRCFCSNTPEVSMDQYVSTDRGWMSSPEIGGALTEIRIEMWDNRFEQLESDTVYILVYPQAWGQGMYAYVPESLGKPSNVISFLVP